MTGRAPSLGWLGILRLGLVQAGLGAVVVLTTSTLNRVMIIELHLPAIVPGILVGLHYSVQVLRPRLGYGSDVGGRRTPWIVGGMAGLALGATAAAGGVALMATNMTAGMVLALAAFFAVGVGVGAAGTSVLTLLANRVDARLRAPAATIVWLMMLLGIAVTATIAGRLLDPFGPERLIAVVGGVALIAFVVAVLAVRGIEGAAPASASPSKGPGFIAALREVWAERQARNFAVFVFISMLAYSAQELVIEPFAGAVFRLTPGQSTGLTGLHGAGGGVRLRHGIVQQAGDAGVDGGRLRGVGRGGVGTGLGRAGRAGGAVAGSGSGAGRRQWRIRGGGHRVDDGAGERRAVVA
jgi:BCD family chlorophyll transporter-like MFS transporter